jgi:Flp pilus assembly protein TadD
MGLALCASALGGCGMMTGNGDDTPPPAGAHATDNTPIAADTTAAIRQAQLLRTSGDLDGATRILSQLMLGAPDDPRIVGEYGKLLVQQGHSADAVQFLRRAIELQPADWTLYSALGVAYDQQSDQPNAKLAYQHALVLKPGEPAILNNFAMSRMLAGDRIAARTLLLQAQASGSTDPKIARNLALLDGTTPPAATVAAPPPRAVAAATPTPLPRPAVVVSNAIAPVTGPTAHAAAPAAQGAPLPIAHGGAQIVMQEVPFDPLAGPVGHAAHPAKPHAKPAALARTGKPAKVAVAARPAKPAPRTLAVNTPAKPPKTAKPAHAGDHIPALRMTADAGKP